MEKGSGDEGYRAKQGRDNLRTHLIKNGEMAATIRQDPYGQGRACVEAALALLEGKAVKYSDPETRSIYFPVEVVTAENVDQYLQ